MTRNKDKRFTNPIRFSKHRITELLVAAEQTASFLPCNRDDKCERE